MAHKRPRQFAPVLFVAVAVLALAACGRQYPNSTFDHTTDFNTAVDALWDRLLLLGTIVFVFVEALLVYTIVRFRKREGAPAPRQVHGHAGLEVAWTAIPVVILALIAVPTVRTIFKTQAKAPAGALEVEVIGHQWWWEFRYPSLGVVTANELYLPAGRTANFSLRTRDVVHSFWAPELGGKRDLITNRTNYLWYTPKDSLAGSVYNGFCTEYCGTSHANMRIRVYVVTPDQFASWAAHQKTPAAGSLASATAGAARIARGLGAAGVAGAPRAAVLPTPAPAAANGDGYVFPREQLPRHAVAGTPLPAGIAFDDALLAQGDAARGRDLVTNLANLGKAQCRTCHVIGGEPSLLPRGDDDAKGPNLTHVASRHTIAAGVYNFDARTLARWIKNAPAMKPGSIMPPQGLGEYYAVTKSRMPVGLTDREIADVVAYLMSLK
ncbi:MAG TPA: cytochrome c oxidase subunit II [Gemmatimonadaceae bacterium]|nr:cytochrome c oxidase subunit II [Gemmatimonadaceae bacterium]